jgi:hypothetical protein
MANVLNEEKKQQVLALGRLGWSLRRIQQEARIRRETAQRLSEGGEDCGAYARSLLQESSSSNIVTQFLRHECYLQSEIREMIALALNYC